MIEVLSSIIYFNFINVGEQTRKLNIREFYIFDCNNWHGEQIISVLLRNELITIDLVGLKENTKVKSIFWENFENKQIELIARKFDLQVERVLDKSIDRNLSSRIALDKNKKLYPVKIAMKALPGSENVLFVIFYLEYPDRTSKGELFIHGIWEVRSDEEFI